MTGHRCCLRARARRFAAGAADRAWNAGYADLPSRLLPFCVSWLACPAVHQDGVCRRTTPPVLGEPSPPPMTSHDRLRRGHRWSSARLGKSSFGGCPISHGTQQGCRYVHGHMERPDESGPPLWTSRRRRVVDLRLPGAGSAPGIDMRRAGARLGKVLSEPAAKVRLRRDGTAD